MKKGSVGETLTWSVAFVIIFVIMLLFVGISSLLASQKAVLDFVGFDEFSEINLEESLGSLGNQDKLFYIINSPVNENKNLKELIIEAGIKGGNLNEEVKKNIEFSLNEVNDEDECYLFEMKYENDDSKGADLKINEGIDRNFINIRKGSSSDAESLVRKFPQTFQFEILYEKEKINVLLFVQKC